MYKMETKITKIPSILQFESPSQIETEKAYNEDIIFFLIRKKYLISY